MPIPFLLGILAVGAAAVGVMGHVDASDKNRNAKNISSQAISLYNESKRKLESRKKESEDALCSLGQTKNEILSGSMKKFIDSYGKLQHIKFKESSTIVNVSDLVVCEEDVLHIQHVTNIYSTAIKDVALGTATGTLMGLAASGSLIATSTAIGGALVAGEIAEAASIAGSAFSGLTAAATSLGFLAAPVALFTGLSASIKADENLSKAQEMLAEARAASSKMELSASLYNGVVKKSDMLKDLLLRLDGMFSFCVNFTEKAISSRYIDGEKLNAGSFEEDELKIIYMTKALAGAVKGVIDTPVLNAKGQVSEAAGAISAKLHPKISSIENGFEEITTNYLAEANGNYSNACDRLANAQLELEREIIKFGILKEQFYNSQILDDYFLFYSEISMAKSSDNEHSGFIDEAKIDSLKWMRDCYVYLFADNNAKTSDDNIKAAVLGLCGIPTQALTESLYTWIKSSPQPVEGIVAEELAIALNKIQLKPNIAIVPNPIEDIKKVFNSVNRIKLAQEILEKSRNIVSDANKTVNYINSICSKLHHQTELFGSLIYMFEISNAMLARCVYKRKGFFGRLFNKTLTRSDFTKEDLDLLDFNFKVSECIRLVSICPMTDYNGNVTKEYEDSIKIIEEFFDGHYQYYEGLKTNQEFYSEADGGKLKNRSDKLITATIKKKFLHYEDKKPTSKLKITIIFAAFCAIIVSILSFFGVIGDNALQNKKSATSTQNIQIESTKSQNNNIQKKDVVNGSKQEDVKDIVQDVKEVSETKSELLPKHQSEPSTPVENKASSVSNSNNYSKKQDDTNFSKSITLQESNNSTKQKSTIQPQKKKKKNFLQKAMKAAGEYGKKIGVIKK